MNYAKEPPNEKDCVVALSKKDDKVDSEVDYREFIFYDRDVVYPEYLIHYTVE